MRSDSHRVVVCALPSSVSEEVVMKRLLAVLLGAVLVVVLLAGAGAVQSKPASQPELRALAEQAPDAVSHAPDEELSDIYIGAVHSLHTAYSDGAASYPEGFYSMLKPIWDWAATTDHDFMLSGEEWKSIVRNARLQTDEKFVSLVGYEWTALPRGTLPSLGHMSVVFRRHDGLGDKVPASASDPLYDSPEKLYPTVRAMDGLAVFAHPNRDEARFDFNDDATYRDDSVARLVSVVNGGIFWSRNWEYASGSGIYSRWKATESSDSGWPRLALDRGYRLGFVGEYDGHAEAIEPARYGYTGVVAGSLTPDGIFDGLKARNTYAVHSPHGVGKRILLKATSNGFLMGDSFRAGPNPLEIRLRGKTDLPGFSVVSLVVNGKIVEERPLSGKKIFEEFSVLLPAGEHYAFFVVLAENADAPGVQASGHRRSMAFTSPMFVTVER
jgi:hypothetical protein